LSTFIMHFRYKAYMHNHSIQVLMLQLLPCICWWLPPAIW
jgi:hypothetical protein